MGRVTADVLVDADGAGSRICRQRLLERVGVDEGRGLSRQRDFHVAAHARFRALMPGIPFDLLFNSGDTSATDIAALVIQAINAPR